MGSDSRQNLSGIVTIGSGLKVRPFHIPPSFGAPHFVSNSIRGTSRRAPSISSHISSSTHHSRDDNDDHNNSSRHATSEISSHRSSRGPRLPTESRSKVSSARVPSESGPLEGIQESDRERSTGSAVSNLTHRKRERAPSENRGLLPTSIVGAQNIPPVPKLDYKPPTDDYRGPIRRNHMDTRVVEELVDKEAKEREKWKNNHTLMRRFQPTAGLNKPWRIQERAQSAAGEVTDNFFDPMDPRLVPASRNAAQMFDPRPGGPIIVPSSSYPVAMPSVVPGINTYPVALAASPGHCYPPPCPPPGHQQHHEYPRYPYYL